MAFPDSFLDEIRTRVPLTALIGRSVKLVKRGREHTGLCPFHHEKSPSFTVNEDKGFYHCFGCGEHGSLFDFIMKTQGLSFREAVERLASGAGIPMPVEDPREGEQRGERETLHAVLEASAVWFIEQLKLRSGTKAREYIDSRALDADSVAHFRIGYAPESRVALKQALLARGFSEANLIAAGMLIKPEDGGETYDRFRDRLMFPIWDARGRVVAFGGRTLGDAQAKYLNSPETSVFHKGTLLYNWPNARAAARDAGTVIVAEGYMDAIALSRAGFRHAVAPLGTAVTETQLAELWRMAPEPILCLDGDNAGFKAALRAARKALPQLQPGHSLRFALLPRGEDPDSLLRKGRVGELKAALANTTPLAQVLWQNLAQGDFSTPERRAGLRRDAGALVSEIAEPTVREYYKRYFREQLDQMFAVRSPARPPFQGRGNQRPGQPRSTAFEPKLAAHLGLGTSPDGITGRRERILIATLLRFPEILERVHDTRIGLNFSDPGLDGLYGAILEIAARSDLLDGTALRAQLMGTATDAVVATLTGSRPDLVAVAALNDAADAEVLWRDVVAQHRLAESRGAARAVLSGEQTSEPVEPGALG